MKSPSFSIVIAFGFFALGGSLVAQDPTAHAPDGGTQQRVESVVILPVPGAPFTAVVTTEWTRIMPDGSTGTTKNHRTVTREELGRKSIDGVDVVGSREVTTLNAGFMGNEKPEPVVKEFWYSPRLGVNVITKRFDPRASAVQNFVVGNINQAEPDARMFEPPQGYRIVPMDGQ
jgi:hypothetical protein